MTSRPVMDRPSDDELVVTHDVVEIPVSTRRRSFAGAAMIITGVVCALAWGLGSRSGDAAFGLSDIADKHQIPIVRIPGKAAGVVLGSLIALLGLWHLVRGFSSRSMRWVLTAVLGCFMVAFLCWTGTGSPGVPVNIFGLLQGTVFLAVPLILGALAGILCERSGVINVAIEGQLLAGAFAGALAATVAHNVGVGIIVAMVAGALIGALLGVFAIRYAVNQVVLGVVLNLLALGLTNFGYDALMQKNPEGFNNPTVLTPIKVPLLGDIPLVGPLLFDANIIVYMTYALIVVVDMALFRTRWGLRTRAVGEHPKAADTVGIKVTRTRYRNVILGGLLAGLGGAYLTIGAVGSFSGNISSGKGFIALAAVIFGRWSPRGAVGAALLFGFADALQTLLSVVGTPVTIPSAFLSMLPYLATLFAVAGLVGRVQAPAADGEPYLKG